MRDPIGTIRKAELRDMLQTLAMARPDLAEGIALVAGMTGLGKYIRLPGAPAQIIVGSQAKRLGGPDEN